MQSPLLQSSRPRRAFTVLEVIMAVTIFGMVAVVIFSVFSSATRTQSITERETAIIQQGRYAMDTFQRDLTNVFFRDETSYNVSITRLIEEMEADRIAAEAANDWDAYYAKYGDPQLDDEEQNPTVGDPYERGMVIDLQMIGQEGTAADNITFAVSHPLTEGAPYRPWGLSRVEYRVDKGWLIRRAESVETERRNILGESLGKQDIPSHSKVAENVTSFKLSYGFWFDSTWYETAKWNSANRQIRNARNTLGNYQEQWQSLRRDGDTGFPEIPDRRDDMAGVLLPGDPGWEEYLNDLDSEPLDRLPAYVRIKLTVADPENKGKTFDFHRIVRLPSAEETWYPDQMLTEDMRDEERGMRDDRYTRVFPGAAEDYK